MRLISERLEGQAFDTIAFIKQVLAPQHDISSFAVGAWIIKADIGIHDVTLIRVQGR